MNELDWVNGLDDGGEQLGREDEQSGEKLWKFMRNEFAMAQQTQHYKASHGKCVFNENIKDFSIVW